MADDRTGRTQTESSKSDDPLALARSFCERVPHSRDLGIVIAPADGPQVCMHLAPQPHLMDEASPAAICSSVLYSLADCAAGLAVLAATRTLTPIATLDLRMNYLRLASGGRAMRVSAECGAVTDDVAFVRCLVHAEGCPDPVATGDATFMRGTHGRQFDAESLSESPPGPLPNPASQASRVSTPARSYSQHLGLEVLTGKDVTKLRLPYRDALVGNALIPALHGGVVGGLIEEAARVAARANLRGTPALRVLNCNVDYHRPARPMDTYASVEIARRTRRTMLANVVCWQSEDRSPVAIGRVQILLQASATGADQTVAGALA